MTPRITSFEVLSILGWNGDKWVRIPSKVDYVSFHSGEISTPSSGSITTENPINPNEFDVYTLGILPSFDMQLVLSINKEATYKNDVINFDINIANNGDDDINDLSFTFPLPIGTDFVQANLEDGITYDSKTNTFTVKGIEPNNSSKVALILQVSPDIPDDELIKAKIKDIVYSGVDSGVSPDILSVDLPVIKADFGVLFDVITPNGDNLNEYLRLKGTDKEEDVVMRIYDTNGVLVYHSDHYGKNYEYFEGYSNIGMFFGSKERLSEGNYYYSVRNSKGKEEAGYIYVRY